MHPRRRPIYKHIELVPCSETDLNCDENHCEEELNSCCDESDFLGSCSEDAINANILDEQRRVDDVVLLMTLCSDVSDILHGVTVTIHGER